MNVNTKVLLVFYAVVAVVPIWVLIFDPFDMLLGASYLLFWGSFRGYHYAKNVRKRRFTEGKHGYFSRWYVHLSGLLNFLCCLFIVARVIYLICP